jgi:hypothetical protein
MFLTAALVSAIGLVLLMTMSRQGMGRVRH